MYLTLRLSKFESFFSYFWYEKTKIYKKRTGLDHYRGKASLLIGREVGRYFIEALKQNMLMTNAMQMIEKQ